MFLPKKKNKLGSISVQIISKSRGNYMVMKWIGCGKTEQEIKKLEFLGKEEIERIKKQQKLFVSESDILVDEIFSSITNSSVRTLGPEIIFGRI